MIAVVVLQCLFSASAVGDHVPGGKAFANSIKVLFEHEKFGELEQLGTKYRMEKSRDAGGAWKLAQFYSELSAAFYDSRKPKRVWEKAEGTAKKWLAAHPESPIPHLVYAKILIDRGWSIRGGGYAGSVKRKDWMPFRANIQDARFHLEKYKTVVSRDPYCYVVMADIGTAQGVRYYLPKWHGSGTDIETFARKALEKTKATEGSGMYARIYWHASQIHYRHGLFSESRVDWPTMKKGMDDVVAKYPDGRHFIKSLKFACMYGENEKAAELIARLKSRLSGKGTGLIAWLEKPVSLKVVALIEWVKRQLDQNAGNNPKIKIDCKTLFSR
jgi:hypothetical protein